MQVKLKFSLVLFLAAGFFALRADAQDEGQPIPEVQEHNQQHSELNLNDDKTLLMDADSKALKGQSNTRDAAVSNVKNKSDNQGKPSSSEKTEEDPLSFN